MKFSKGDLVKAIGVPTTQQSTMEVIGRSLGRGPGVVECCYPNSEYKYLFTVHIREDLLEKVSA